jgi:transcriptional regulator with XRE-family HTH domain
LNRFAISDYLSTQNCVLIEQIFITNSGDAINLIWLRCLCQLSINLPSEVERQAMRGDRLARIRELRQLSQADLAEMVGLGMQQIYRYENGKTQPDGDVVARIAQALEVSTDFLLGLTDSPTPYIQADLTEHERRALNAWRKGEKYEAIKEIINDN